MPAAFRTTRVVEFADTDMAGIIHFAAFFRYMEAAEHEFLRSRGLSVAWRDAASDPVGFPRVSASCDYRTPARFQDVLDIAVTPARVGRKSVTYEFEFTRQGEPIARGQITAVCCRTTPDHGCPMAPGRRRYQRYRVHMRADARNTGVRSPGWRRATTASWAGGRYRTWWVFT